MDNFNFLQLFLLLIFLVVFVWGLFIILRLTRRRKQQPDDDFVFDGEGHTLEKEILDGLINSADLAVIITDQEGKIRRMNTLAEIYTGWSVLEAKGKVYARVLHYSDVGRKIQENDPVEEVLQNEAKKPILIHGKITKNGHAIPISGKVGAIYSPEGVVRGSVISFRDCSAEDTLELEIEGLLKNSVDMIWVSDMQGLFRRVNQKFEEVLGYTKEEVQGKSCVEFIHQDDIQQAFAVFNTLPEQTPSAGFTCRFLDKAGGIKYIRWVSSVGQNGLVFTYAQDVTEKAVVYGQPHDQANRDPLTGVYNAQFLSLLIEEEIKRSELLNLPLSMAILDVDHFKQVNDTWGHPVGDDLLRMVSSVSRNILRQSDMIIRLEGERFMVLMPQTALDGGRKAGEKVRTAIENNWHPIVGKQTVSVGVAERKGFETSANWINRVEEALHQAKESGRNRVITIS